MSRAGSGYAEEENDRYGTWQGFIVGRKMNKIGQGITETWSKDIDGEEMY